MTTPDNKKSDRSSDEVLAGEYVLGVLPAEERRLVEQRLRHDKSFARMVGRWEFNLSDFNEEYAPDIVPPPYVYRQIEEELWGEPQAEARPAIWSSLMFWRGLALTSTAFAAILAIAMVANMRTPTPESGTRLAQLTADGDGVNLVAYYDGAAGSLRLTPAATGGMREKSLELWVIEDGGAPKSLGIIPFDGDREIIVPPGLRDTIHDGVTLAVTLEPFGGAPNGVATGPVVLSGKVGSI